MYRSSLSPVVALTLLASVLINCSDDAVQPPDAGVDLSADMTGVEAGADGPVADGPAADGPVADGPVADGPAGDGPVADGPAADGPVADGPIADGPAADGPGADGPVADSSQPDALQPDTAPADAAPTDATPADAAPADGPQSFTLSGTAEDGQTESPLAGATVYVVGAVPANSTTSNSQGQFSLTVTTTDVVIRADKTGYLSVQKRIKAPSSGFGMPLVPPAMITSLGTQAGLPAQSATKAIVAVDLNQGAVGQSASLTAPNGGSLVLDATDKAVKGNTILTTKNALVAFVNVTPGSTQVTFSPTGKCSLPFSSYPVSANVMTAIDATCTP